VCRGAVAALLGLLGACGGSSHGPEAPAVVPLEGLALTVPSSLADLGIEIGAPVGSGPYTARVGWLVREAYLYVSAGPGVNGRVNGYAPARPSLDYPFELPLDEGENVLDIALTKDSVTSHYTLVITRQTVAEFVSDAYLKAANAASEAAFGFSVAASLDTLVVGSPFESSAAQGIDGDPTPGSTGALSGAAYVFVRDSAGDWAQQAYLKASNAEPGDMFGWSLALVNDTLAVGAIGEASASAEQLDNDAVGAGAVYVFSRTDGVWSQSGYLKAPNADAGDAFGSAVAVNVSAFGSVQVAVGAPFEDAAAGGGADNTSADSGAVYVFAPEIGDAPTYLKAPNAGAGDRFGAAVAVRDDFLVVGAPFEDSAATGIDGDGTDDSAPDAGSAYLYAYDLEAVPSYLKASNTDAGDHFGSSVASSGWASVLVGAPDEDGASPLAGGGEPDNSTPDAGAVYYFSVDDTAAWQQEGHLKASNADAGDRFGASLAMIFAQHYMHYFDLSLVPHAVDFLAIGAPGEDSAARGAGGDPSDDTLVDSGAVYFFTRGYNEPWSEWRYIKASNSTAGAGFGSAMALDFDTLAVGAPSESGGAPSAERSGAAYTFGGPSSDIRGVCLIDSNCTAP
jgi:hypothetical protein